MIHDEFLCEGCRQLVPIEKTHVSTKDVGTHTVSKYLSGGCERKRKVAMESGSERARRKV